MTASTSPRRAARRSVAVDGGIVAYAGNELRGYGNLVLVKHSSGWISAYAHCEELLVKRGDKVSRGQTIAKVGATGGVNEPQLHFELRRGKRAVDPREFLAPAPSAGAQERRARRLTRTYASGLPRRPARSWMNCQATRPEREPRVIDHSPASALSWSGGRSRP